jgi:predicted acetyltransferase
MFKCEVGNVFSGYFAIEEVVIGGVGRLNMLNGFFIVPSFRTAEYKKAFIKALFTRFDKGILVGLYAKNERAIKFFKKLGAKEIMRHNAILTDIGEVEYVIMGLQKT